MQGTGARAQRFPINVANEVPALEDGPDHARDQVDPLVLGI